MAEDDPREEFEDPWKPGTMPPESEADPLELPEPEITPPDIGGLEQAVPLRQALPQPDMTLPLPGQEGSPFQTGGDGGGQAAAGGPQEPAAIGEGGGQAAAGGDGLRELVAIGERIAESMDEIKETLDELVEKLEDNTGIYGS